ncbi:uncharacterized protein FTJAE_3486 [Fusarium tjaetaba]|uniref:Uncharacterized protein n=1 Tax=Fusarium tjaetaba TaxID=1567544 RepID=A0A8H5W235_9HYPO|nr:uncharacterized protein FTJAE_3486 [Fusarium tjaetaba]KAF5642770.1 hypothetical protein FTJAE_3486 [Fusarium tjaetaba]
MQDTPSPSSVPSNSGHSAVTVGVNTASLSLPAPEHLHNVNTFLWELSYQSVTATLYDHSEASITPLNQYPSYLFSADSGSPSHPQPPHLANGDINQQRSTSPTTPGTIDSGLASPRLKKVLVTKDQGKRLSVCPDCRAYTSDRCKGNSRENGEFMIMDVEHDAAAKPRG